MGKHLYNHPPPPNPPPLPTTGSTGKILVADVHRTQQTDDVKARLKKKNTELLNVPPGCTSRVQPLDVSFNKPI